MGLESNCPANTALESIPYNPCLALFGKDTRWGIQRQDDANNLFVNGVNGIEEEASWTALPDALGNTKVTITPYLEAPNLGDPDTLEDSENEDGAPIAVGEGAQLVTAIVRNPTPAQYSALKSYEEENGKLTLYRFDNKGKIGARLIGSDHAGIEISRGTFLVKSPSKGETRGDQSKMMIQFYLPAGWFETFDVVTPEAGFNPLTEIKPA